MGIAHDKFETCYAQGLALANSGNYLAALAKCDKALSFVADDPACWVLRGVVLIHLKRYAEAVSSCDRALEIAPNHQEAWLIRGAALNHLGRYQQCYRSYNQALGLEQQSWVQQLMQLPQRFQKIVNSTGFNRD